MNACTRGENCTYSHCPSSLAQLPDLYKTSPCSKFASGKCADGEQCTFAHGLKELRSAPEAFKTSFCRYFQRGECKLGDSCRYSHDKTKIQPASQEPPAKSPVELPAGPPAEPPAEDPIERQNRSLEALTENLLALRQKHEEEVRRMQAEEKQELERTLQELSRRLATENEVSAEVLERLSNYSKNMRAFASLSCLFPPTVAEIPEPPPSTAAVEAVGEPSLYSLPPVGSWPSIAETMPSTHESGEWDLLIEQNPSTEPAYLESASSLAVSDSSPHWRASILPRATFTSRDPLAEARRLGSWPNLDMSSAEPLHVRPSSSLLGRVETWPGHLSETWPGHLS